MKPEIEQQNSILNTIRITWPKLNFFERFEYVISLCIMVMIVAIVTVSLIRLGKNVYTVLIVNALDPLEFKVFQLVFGNILTLFIAMEFMNSVEGVLKRQGHIVEVQNIILIALLAIARKFIVMDTKVTSSESMIALAIILLSLGLVYWLIKANKSRKDGN